MLRYTPGDSFVHELDPRSKLTFQVGFAITVFAHPTPAWLVGTTVVGLAVVVASHIPLRSVVRSYRYVVVFLALGPLLAGVMIGPPWFRVAPATRSALLVSRAIPVLLVSAAYVHTTPIRESRAAIQRLVPGRVGQTLGVGIALVFRTFPLVLDDVNQVREASAARAGNQRPIRSRVRTLVVQSVRLALGRADRLAVALQARCFAWNPTLPSLRFSRLDYPVLVSGFALALVPFVELMV